MSELLDYRRLDWSEALGRPQIQTGAGWRTLRPDEAALYGLVPDGEAAQRGGVAKEDAAKYGFYVPPGAKNAAIDRWLALPDNVNRAADVAGAPSFNDRAAAFLATTRGKVIATATALGLALLAALGRRRA